MEDPFDPYVVRADGLGKAYPGVRALDAVRLRVRENVLYAVAGPEGAGKTTLVSILATGVRPDSGTVVVAGHDVVGDVLRARGRVGVVMRDAPLDESRSAGKNLLSHGALYGMPPSVLRRAVPEVLALVDLADAEHRRVGALPAEARVRLAIGRALLHDPALLILDEPTADLDREAGTRLWQCLRELRLKRWLTIVVATADIAEIDECQMACLLDHGKVVAAGTPDKLRQHYGADLSRLAGEAGAASAG